MPFFECTARDRSGKLMVEVMEAFSREEVINSLQARGLYVVSIKPTSKERKKERIRRTRYHRSVKINDLIMFASETSVLLNSGITLIRSLEILCKQIESSRLLHAVEQIKKDIEGGFTFQNALKKQPKVFSEFWVHLVETGEASGHLPLAFEQLAEYLEASAALRKKIISATVYPVLLTCVAIVGIIIFLVKIIPVFSEIFKGFGVELPLLTRMVISASNIVQDYFLVFIGIMIAIFFVARKYVSTDIGKWQFDKLKFNLPMLGRIIQEISIERFTSALSTLLNSGVPILHALDISEKMAGNKFMEKELKNVKLAVRDGKAIAQTMQENPLFPPILVQMIGVGEEVGELGKMLERVSSYYKERIDTFVTRAATVFEPFVLIFMGIVIGVLVVAMFMPIFNISSAVRATG